MTDHAEHIERYLRGELTGDDLKAFETRMEYEADFRKQVEDHRQLLKGLEIGFNQEMKELLVKEEASIGETPQNQHPDIRKYYPLLGIAAAVLVLIISIFVFREVEIDTDELYAQYYVVYPNIEQPVVRSEDQTDNPFNFYESGDYGVALSIFQKRAIAVPSNPAWTFYSGVCQLELQQYEEAKTSFESILDIDSEKYSRPATWYFTLTLIKLQEIERAIVYLEELVDGTDVYANNSKKLLEQIK